MSDNKKLWYTDVLLDPNATLKEIAEALDAKDREEMDKALDEFEGVEYAPLRIFIALRIHETDVLGVFSSLEKALAVKPDAVDEYEIDTTEYVATYDHTGKRYD